MRAPSSKEEILAARDQLAGTAAVKRVQAYVFGSQRRGVRYFVRQNVPPNRRDVLRHKMANSAAEAITTLSHGRISQPTSRPSERASANSMQRKLCGMVHTLTETSFPRRPKTIRAAKACSRSVGWDGRQAIPSHLRMQSGIRN